MTSKLGDRDIEEEFNLYFNNKKYIIIIAGQGCKLS